MLLGARLTTVTVAGLCEATRYIAGYLYCWAIWIEVRTFEITKNIWYLRVQMFVIVLKTSGPLCIVQNICKSPSAPARGRVGQGGAGVGSGSIWSPHLLQPPRPQSHCPAPGHPHSLDIVTEREK